MSEPLRWGLSVHGAPVLAEFNPGTAGLILRFDRVSIYPYIAMFCDETALASDLADAINNVLEKHRADESSEIAASERASTHGA